MVCRAMHELGGILGTRTTLGIALAMGSNTLCVWRGKEFRNLLFTNLVCRFPQYWWTQTADGRPLYDRRVRPRFRILHFTRAHTTVVGRRTGRDGAGLTVDGVVVDVDAEVAGVAVRAAVAVLVRLIGTAGVRRARLPSHHQRRLFTRVKK